MAPRETCPRCESKCYKRNGHIHTGKQNHRCKVCSRAFVLTPDNVVITAEQRALIERLLLERISLRGICRAVGGGLQWLLQFMVTRFQAAPEHLYVKPADNPPAVILQRLEAELDELWSFVGKKANRHWVWIAMDATSRQVLAFHVGDRSSQSAQALWKKIPAVYQEQAVFYTDHYTAGDVLKLDNTLSYTPSPNSYRLTNIPITRSCICTDLEKQIVFRANRLMRVRSVRCLRSILWVCRLPG